MTRRILNYSLRPASGLFVVVAILMFANSAFASGPLEKVIHNFQFNNGTTLDGDNPLSRLIADAAGNLYGTTRAGGVSTSCPCGTVFELSPPTSPGGTWTETLLHSFSGGATEGANPMGVLLFDSAGNLYGTTSGGGLNNQGTVFQLSPPATAGGSWTETILYIFPSNGSRGTAPGPNLVFDHAGNLYGTTDSGGSGSVSNCPNDPGGCGVVFELSPPVTSGGPWTQRIIYTFGLVADDGYGPTNLTFDRSGALYGTTFTSAGGAVFQLVRDHGTWSKNVVYSFNSGLGGPDALTFDSSGNLFAVAHYGGDLVDCDFVGCGGVFEVSPPAVSGDPWVETTLYTFTGGKDGSGPMGKLVTDKAGNLYGTARVGGLKNSATHDNGTVFELSPPAVSGGAWTETTLHEFGGTHYNDGSQPFGGVTFVKGKFYGTTSAGGSLSFGTVFSLVVVP